MEHRHKDAVHQSVMYITTYERNALINTLSRRTKQRRLNIVNIREKPVMFLVAASLGATLEPAKDFADLGSFAEFSVSEYLQFLVIGKSFQGQTT